MEQYGVSSNGFKRKRLSVIRNDLYDEIENQLGIDLTLNPQSYLNVICTIFANRVSRIWELAERIYLSRFPSTAEGMALDNVALLNGIERGKNAKARFKLRVASTRVETIPYGTPVVIGSNQYICVDSTTVDGDLKNFSTDNLTEEQKELFDSFFPQYPDGEGYSYEVEFEAQEDGKRVINVGTTAVINKRNLNYVFEIGYVSNVITEGSSILTDSELRRAIMYKADTEDISELNSMSSIINKTLGAGTVKIKAIEGKGIAVLVGSNSDETNEEIARLVLKYKTPGVATVAWDEDIATKNVQVTNEYGDTATIVLSVITTQNYDCVITVPAETSEEIKNKVADVVNAYYSSINMTNTVYASDILFVIRQYIPTIGEISSVFKKSETTQSSFTPDATAKYVITCKVETKS